MIWISLVFKILNVYYGEGMSGIWKTDSKIEIDGESFLRKSLPKKGEGNDESLFYIPAQRIISISDGRPKNFMEFDSSSPYVLRSFSETLRLFMQHGMGNADVLFPMKNRLKGFLRSSFDESITIWRWVKKYDWILTPDDEAEST